MKVQSWNLVGDIGGTNARFGVADSDSGQLQLVKHYSVADHRAFADAIAQFLKDVSATKGWKLFPKAACFALACPISDGTMRFTNSPWYVDPAEVGTLLNHAPVEFINDFAAVGYAVTDLKIEDRVEVSPAKPVPTSPIVVLGPGTGLGVCTVVPVESGYRVLPGEGGHVDFSPVDDLEIKILQYLAEKYGRVSAERVLSGSGIQNIYHCLADVYKQKTVFQTAAEISSAAIEKSDSLAVETLEVFCRSLGSLAGNLALTLDARGGVFIAGGIVPRFIDFLLNSDFKKRFESKGRFSDVLSNIPVMVVTKHDLGLAGAVKKLNLSEL